MKGRIRPPRKFNGVLNVLTVEQGVFATKQKALMFASALGRKSERLNTIGPLESPGEGIRLELFESVGDDGFVQALAVEHDKSFKVLDEDAAESRSGVFEVYAEKGLEKIELAIRNNREDVLAAVQELLDTYGFDADEMSELPGLGGLVDHVERQL